MYHWRRGATFTLGLRVESGVATGTEIATCWIKRAKNGCSPGDGVDPVVVMSTTFVAAAGDEPAMWLFEATPAQGVALTPGQYIADARIELDTGVVIQTASVLIDVDDRVTESA